MRDHRKLRAFALAHRLVLDVYRLTRVFPSGERYGLTAQIRRAAVSIPSNIVEGSARDSVLEYIRFLEMAYGSSIEVEYQLELAKELALVTDQNYRATIELARNTAMTLNSLVRALRNRAHKRSSLLPEARRLRPFYALAC